MTLLLLVATAAAGGLATILLAKVTPTWAIVVGLLAGVATLGAALAIDPAETVSAGGAFFAASDPLRTTAVAWAGATILLGLVDALTAATATILGPSLLGLALAVVALATPDASIGLALLAAGAIAAVVAPDVRNGESNPSQRSRRAVAFRIVVVSTLLALGVIAWGSAPGGALARGSAVLDEGAAGAIGLALLAIAAAVVLRTAAIPAHAWAARLIEGIPATALPALLGWGSATFAVVAFAWTSTSIGVSPAPLDLERGSVALVAVVCVVLGGIAAWLHEDVEHVLVYSLVQDAGVILFAFVSPSPGTTPVLLDWAFAAAAVKSALAGWVATARSTFGVHAIPELAGWARRSPLLGLGFAIVLVAAVGVPGMAAFDARLRLIDAGLWGPLDILVSVAALAPLVYLGRILATGLGRPSSAVSAADGVSLRWRGGRTDGWSGDRSARSVASSFVGAILAVPAEIGANRLALASIVVVALGVLGLAVAAAGLEPAVGGGGQ